MDLLILVSMPPGVEHTITAFHFLLEDWLILVSMPPGVEHFVSVFDPALFVVLILVSMPPGVEHYSSRSLTAHLRSDPRLDASGR